MSFKEMHAEVFTGKRVSSVQLRLKFFYEEKALWREEGK